MFKKGEFHWGTMILFPPKCIAGFGSLAQSVEREAVNLKVVGSNPTGAAFS
jgi:hypothetical protein